MVDKNKPTNNENDEHCIVIHTVEYRQSSSWFSSRKMCSFFQKWRQWQSLLHVCSQGNFTTVLLWVRIWTHETVKGFDILNLLVTLGTAKLLGIHDRDLNPYRESDKTQWKEPLLWLFVFTLCPLPLSKWSVTVVTEPVLMDLFLQV